MKILLDTSFLIELKKGNERAAKALRERRDKCEDIMVSALTVYELFIGAKYLWKKHGNVREAAIIGEMLKPLTVVPVDSNVVERASEVRAELMLKGLDVPDLDVLIACSADGEVLTFDKDFAPLRDLGFKITIFER